MKLLMYIKIYYKHIIYIKYLYTLFARTHAHAHTPDISIDFR